MPADAKCFFFLSSIPPVFSPGANHMIDLHLCSLVRLPIDPLWCWAGQSTFRTLTLPSAHEQRENWVTSTFFLPWTTADCGASQQFPDVNLQTLAAQCCRSMHQQIMRWLRTAKHYTSVSLYSQQSAFWNSAAATLSTRGFWLYSALFSLTLWCCAALRCLSALVKNNRNRSAAGGGGLSVSWVNLCTFLSLNDRWGVFFCASIVRGMNKSGLVWLYSSLFVWGLLSSSPTCWEPLWWFKVLLLSRK